MRLDEIGLDWMGGCRLRDGGSAVVRDAGCWSVG